ncbi:MAG: pilin [Minisyncoccia bacterium]
MNIIQKIKNVSINFFPSILYFLIPHIAKAQGSTSGWVYICGSGNGDCTWSDLVAAVRHFINQATVLAIGFCVVVIAWAGFKYMTSEGNPGKIKEATGMFTKVAIGMAFIIGAWAIVTLIGTALGVTAFKFSTS